MAAPTDDEYLDWIYDPRRNQARVFLIELDHSAGTLRFGSAGWMSDALLPYDDAISGKPVMQDSLEDFFGIGDIDLINTDTSVDWLTLNFRGYPCRWYYGDVAWPFADFRQIASATISGCRLLTERLFRFDLLDNGQSLKRTFTASSSTQSGTVQAVITWVLAQAGLPAPTYVNIDSGWNMDVSIDVTATSRIDTTIKQLAASVGSYVRYNQTGGLEVYRPNTLIEPDIQLNNDNIGFRGLNQVEVLPAYKNVTVIKYDGTELTGTTTAPTGVLDEEIRIETQLTDTSEANLLLAEKIAYHDTVHSIWEVPILDVGGIIQVGDRIGIDHALLFANSTVQRMSRSPLSPPFTYVELLV